MNVLLSVLGSRGDLNPYLSIGVNLKKRGHQVTVITSEIYHQVVAKAGLNFISCHSAAEYYQAQNNPDLYHPRKGYEVFAEHLLGTMRKLYYSIAEFNPAETLLISSQLMLGAHLANEKKGFPLINLALQPAAFWSVEEPAVRAGTLFLPKLPAFIRRLVLHKVEKDYIDGVLSVKLNHFRKELNLPAVNKIYSSWVFSPGKKIIGLFPDWFAKPALDWPTTTALTGFVNFDENAHQALPKEILEFLTKGEPPVILTYGTANTQGQYFFKTFIEAARRLHLRLLILTQYPEQLPALKLDRECHASYISLLTVLSKTRAIVHHGGIGTIAQALATATPQLLVPLAHDQFDNAVRLKKMGAAECLISRKNYSVAKAMKKLENLLTSTAIKSQCRSYAEKINFSRAEQLTCELIERSAGIEDLVH